MDLSQEMQAQAKALANPSRFSLFEYITHSEEPVGVAELTELLGFNHNAIRQHLAVLVEAGLVLEADEKRNVRGRPRKLYALRSDALSAFSSVSGSYERLAELLLDVATTSDSPYEIGLRSGAERSLDPAADPSVAITLLAHQLAVGGFDPVIDDAGHVTLAHCPFADVAAKDPSIICELHRGLIDGYLSTQEPAMTHNLVIRPPHTAGCRVEIVAKVA